MKETTSLREALDLLKRELGGIRGALERIETGLARVLDAFVESEAEAGGVPQRVADGSLFTAPSPAGEVGSDAGAIEDVFETGRMKEEEEADPVLSSPFDLSLLSLSDTPGPVASPPVATPPPDDELERLLATASSRAKHADQTLAPEKRAAVGPESSSSAIDALLGGLFAKSGSNEDEGGRTREEQKAESDVSSSGVPASPADTDRFDLSVSALEDLLGGGKAGR